MAIYKIFPTQDATLYSSYPDKNTGLDAILEASLTYDAYSIFPQASRFLIQFSSEDIADVINNRISGAQWDANLKCFIAEVSGLTQDTSLDVYAVSQSWNMGTGRFLNNPETQNGTSWSWRNFPEASAWTDGTFASGTTGSYFSGSIIGGGTWYVTQSLSGSQTFGYYSSKDIDINVTNIVSAWYSGSYENNGFIVKQREEFVIDTSVQPKIKYFSIDTNTIYPPQLEFRWDDCVLNPSTLPTLNELPAYVSIGNNPGEFIPGSINKFRVYSRPQFPARVFSTASYFTQNYYLPEESYYAIKDLDTNEYVINFDEVYTKLSSDATSNYFILYMNGLEPERYYKVLIKTSINGSLLMFDDNYYFKIVYR